MGQGLGKQLLLAFYYFYHPLLNIFLPSRFLRTAAWNIHEWYIPIYYFPVNQDETGSELDMLAFIHYHKLQIWGGRLVGGRLQHLVKWLGESMSQKSSHRDTAPYYKTEEVLMSSHTSTGLDWCLSWVSYTVPKLCIWYVFYRARHLGRPGKLFCLYEKESHKFSCNKWIL